ncbi:MAG TPA: molybdopterin-dependent oxidoreductase, partial [Ilumatobacter sp.]
LAALVGIATVRGRRDIAIGGAVVLGVVGILASSTGRNTRVVGANPSLVAAGVAGAVLLVAHRIACPAARRPAAGEPASDADGAPRALPAMGPDRRTLLLTGTGVAAAAVLTGSLGRFMHRRLSNAADRAGVALPAADVMLPAPPADPALGIAGLTPLFVPNTSFYRIDTALVVPSVALGSWRLRVTGMVDNELEFTFDDLLALPQVEADITISCVSNEVGGDLVGNARWQGVRLDDLLSDAGISPDADQIVGRSVDGFTAGFPTATLDGRNALVALAMNGEPLPTRHGFPARLVVPGLYGYVSATKWLSAIELTRFDQFEGYWVPRGWSALAPVKTQSRIDRPGGRIAAGRTAVAGVAWAPTRGISTVEVRVDDEPWRTATLGPSVGDDSWRQWWIDWDATPGRHSLMCRATDGTGDVQTEARSRPDPDGATGWHTITVTVDG